MWSIFWMSPLVPRPNCATPQLCHAPIVPHDLNDMWSIFLDVTVGATPQLCHRARHHHARAHARGRAGRAQGRGLRGRRLRHGGQGGGGEWESVGGRGGGLSCTLPAARVHIRGLPPHHQRATRRPWPPSSPWPCGSA